MAVLGSIDIQFTDSSSYTWIVYADEETGTGMSISPIGKQFMGIAYNKKTAEASMIPADYSWSRITGEGIPGPPGTDGQTLYTWVKYADSPTTGMNDSPTGKTYLGIAYNKTTATESTVYADYSWSLIKGDAGPAGNQGIQGIQGPAGANGQTLYTWIKYADSPTTGMNDLPDGKKYIGFAYNKTTAIESTLYADYTWSLIEGPQGVQGPNGQTLYTWLKYADSPTTGMSDTPTGKTYMGVAYNKTTATESVVYADYSWSLIKGDTGATGPQGPTGLQGIQGPTGNTGIQGPAGANGVSSYTHIAYATNATGTTGFSTTDPVNKTYIGMYVDQTALDSTDPTKYKWTLIKGADGSQGIPGTPGTNGQTPYLHIAYATNATGTTGFSTTVSTGKTYIGTYTDFISADSTDPTKYTWLLIQGPQGPQGQQGIPGVAGADGVTYYTWIKYADSPTTGMSDSPTGKAYMGIAVNKTTAVESNVYGDYTWSLTQGAQGIQGPNGADGQPTYTWVKYADDVNGAGLSDSPTNKRFLGLAHNKTTATESTIATDYVWSPLYDNVSVGVSNLYIDSRLQRVTASNGTPVRTVTAGSGSNLYKLTWSAGTNFAFQQTTADRKINYTQGLDYTLSFEIRGNISTLGYVYMMRNSGEGANSSFSPQNVTLDATNWTKVKFNKNAPWSTSTGYVLIGSQDASAGKWFEVRNVKIEQGNVASDWTPHIDDTLQQDTDYNGVAFNSANGVVVTSTKNKLTMNASKGLEILRTSDGKVMFNVDASTGNIGFAGGLNGATGTFTGDLAGTDLTLSGLLSFPTASTENETTGMKGRYSITEPYAAYNSKTLDGDWHFTSSSIGFKAKVTDQKDATTYYGTSYFGATMVKLRAYATSSNSAYSGTFSGLNNRLDMSPGKFTMGQSGSSTDPDWPDNIKITADGTIIATVKIQSGNVYLNGGNSIVNTADSLFLTGKGNATLAIGQDGTGTLVQSLDVYNRTYSFAANMYVTNFGTIGRATSARKYKIDEQPISNDLVDKILNLVPKTWYDKPSSESYSNLLTREMNGEIIDWSKEDIPYIERVPGLIAEDVEAAGLSQYVIYGDPDENGAREVEGLMYERLLTLLIPLVKKLNDRITVLEGGTV
jgi:hypothetical protein